MNSHVTICVNATAAITLQCAYKTLHSFEMIENTYIEELIYTCYARISYSNLPMAKKACIPCLITIEPLTEQSCKLTLSANIVNIVSFRSYSSEAGWAQEFVSDFLRRFARMLKGEACVDNPSSVTTDRYL